MALIQDKARLRVSKATTEFLHAKGVWLIKQPPYSPDCNLCDHFVFLVFASRVFAQKDRFCQIQKGRFGNVFNGNKAVIYTRKMEKAFKKMVIVTLNSLFNMRIITFESAYGK